MGRCCFGNRDGKLAENVCVTARTRSAQVYSVLVLCRSFLNDPSRCIPKSHRVRGLPLSRRRSRELAVQILYQIEMSGHDPETALKLFWEHYPQPDIYKEFTVRLVKGAMENRKKIDRCIKKTAENWSFSRLTPVDRSILRIAVFELLFCPDIPYKVTLNEAIELGKKFGSEKSGIFINGVLDNVFKHNPDVKKRSPDSSLDTTTAEDNRTP